MNFCWGVSKNIKYQQEYKNAMVVKTNHWGEIPDENPSYTPDISEDIKRAMDSCCLSEFDSEDHVGNQVEQLIIPPADPLISYAIELHKHANEMTDMIRLAEIAKESNLIPCKDAALTIPEKPVVFKQHVPNNLNFIPKEFTAFTEGEDVDYPELSEAVAKEILVKCIATLFAHIGYETTHESVLHLMADVLEQFLKKVALKFKISKEEENKVRRDGFPCYPEKVFMELGLGGIKNLHDYYENRVVKYVNVLHARSADLNERYEKLMVPKCESPIETSSNNTIMRVKIEEEEDLVEVEMHFPIEGVGFSSLEPGYQLLNSLEANLGETKEEIIPTVESSPGMSAISESDVTPNLSPFTKKKRLK